MANSPLTILPISFLWPRRAPRALAGRPAPGASAKGAEGAAKDAAPPRGRELAPGIFLQRGTGRAVLSGPGLTAGRLDALEAWLKDGA